MKHRIFWPIVLAVFGADFVTKRWAEVVLIPGVAREVLGATWRWRLAYNPGAALGVHAGQYSRPLFLAIAVIGVAGLLLLFHRTERGHRLRILSLALVVGGALGNARDRLASSLGVVDFIDVGVGRARFPTFNLADVAVFLGAMGLAVVFRSASRTVSA